MKKISINYINGVSNFKIVPGSIKRKWMEGTPDKFAYHCTPLNVANTYGWTVLNPEEFSVEWTGYPNNESMIVNDGRGSSWVTSHFGNGVFTISVDFVIRTPTGVSTYIRGVPNEPYDALQPLDAVIETDWLPFTFTYNYLFTSPAKVIFKKDEPLFTFFPVERSYIENFNIQYLNIESDPVFFKQYQDYVDSRKKHLDNKETSRQKFYTNGVDPNGKKYKISNHIKKYNLPRDS
jgi:hypothetical protein